MIAWVLFLLECMNQKLCSWDENKRKISWWYVSFCRESSRSLRSQPTEDGELVLLIGEEHKTGQHKKI